MDRKDDSINKQDGTEVGQAKLKLRPESMRFLGIWKQCTVAGDICKTNKKINKLGQRQSQTPFSSAFWVQKRCWVQKQLSSQQILGPKNVSGQK